MAVHSNTFGGLHLTGEDARKFKAQTRSASASKAARDSASKGKAMARQLIRSGVVRIDKAVD